MALFPPRKKTAPASSSMEPLSKAHKILGSTPLSIDSPPPNRDDASSSDDTSLTSVTSCDDAFDDVGIAKSDNDSDLFPRPPRLDFDDSDAGRSILRKSRSSSTIKSWYDKSKLPLSVSQQTSSSAMAKGPPTAGYCHHKPRRHHKKMPAGLEIGASPLNPVAHLGQPAVELVLGPERVMKSPSIFSTITQRPRHRRHTEETLLTPRRRAPWPRPNDALNELPTLYDNYEKRSMRHVMRQYSQPDLSQPKPLLSPAQPKKNQQAGGCPNWFHDHAPLRITRDWKFSEKRSPTTNSTRTVSSRQTQTSGSSKTTEKSFGYADLRQTSVLSLSDSEGEDDVVMPYLKSPTLASVKRRPSLMSIERRPSMPEIRLPPRVASRSKLYDEASTDVESVLDADKLKKRASFSLAHSHTTLPSRAMDSASGTRSLHPRRASVASTHSANSAHSRTSSYSIREARAVTLQAARHKSSPVRETPVEVPQQAVDWKPTFERDSVASSSADQLTPPLSPTSVDFYMRSARSSVDGPNTHSRLMAVSRQEEMLLSALRHRQRNIRSSSLAELRESNEWEREGEGEAARQEDDGLGTERWRYSAQRRSSRDHRLRVSRRPTAELAVIGLELGGRHERHSGGQSLRRWSAAATADPESGRCNKHDSEDSICDQFFEKVPLFLDTEPRPDLSDLRDWHAALTSRSERRENGSKPGSDAEPNQVHPESFARLAGVTEESLGAEPGVPRPDSPVSPEAFPAVPSERTSSSKTARLSVQGPGLLAAGSETRGRPGWEKLRGKTIDSA
ncbi:hypothetical protein L249_8604 [Ophiocordyceps polyrhachis-furcata BCC 54312]|uniref:Uncharacterized protein n=1 Tax=Ophiocordyceps polyrhachis-furcata BCC 54312 TaxID=1330021 RepID=A0A367L6T0_9HYPO|nr:hypothetical protein L249_8604 [Ophiocordyceps polyrhachis-furcata BCC 54312]